MKFLIPVFLLFIILSGFHSQAGLSCNQAGSTKISMDLIRHADFLDDLNAKANGLALGKPIAKTLIQGTRGKSGLGKIRTALQIRKLRKYLETIPVDKNIDRVELQELAIKLEKIAFLINDKFFEKLNYTDKLKIHDIRQSIFYHGLEKYLGDRIVESSKLGKAWRLVKLILRPQVLKSFTPEDLAFKVAVEGYEANKNLMREHGLSITGKKGANLLLTSYSVYLLMAVVIIPLGSNAIGTYTAAMVGKENAIQNATQMADDSKKMADKKTIDDSTYNRNLQLSVEKFTAINGREPVGLELELYKALARGDMAAAKEMAIMIDKAAEEDQSVKSDDDEAPAIESDPAVVQVPSTSQEETPPPIEFDEE